MSPVSWRTLKVCSYSSSAVHSAGASVETQPDSPHSGSAPTETMTAWYLASEVPLANVPESVAAVIGACPGEVTIASNGTPSRCSADCQETKSGSVVEVPSTSTFMSMRWAADAAPAVAKASTVSTDTRVKIRTIGFLDTTVSSSVHSVVARERPSLLDAQ